MSLPSAQNTAGLSIFFPAYNDAATIASLVIAAVQTAARLTPDFEVLVVNDGSTDATAAMVDELARIYPQVRAVHHTRNRGYGGALRSGFASVTREFVFYTDGDAQYDPRELERLWARMGAGVDFVNGYKISRSDPLHRKIIGRVYHHTVKRLFGLRVRDVDCDFRLMRRAIFERVHLEKASGVICLEMMKKIQDAGFRIAEVPVHHYHRAHGKSQFFNVRRLVRTAWDVMRLWDELVLRPGRARARAARRAAGTAADEADASAARIEQP
jgi:glycosyltransferase involved in cell wall biosynthesis